MARELSLEEFDQQFPDTGAVTPKPVAPAASTSNQYGALIPATGQEGPLLAAGKAAVNYPSSLIHDVGSFAMNVVKHPIATAKGVANLAIDIPQKAYNFGKSLGEKSAGKEPGTRADTSTLDAAIGVYKDRYGTLDSARKTAINDPFGVGLDILGVLQGGAAVTGKTAQLNNALSKTAQVVTSPVAGATSKLANTVSSATKFGVSQATGLSPETIATITKNPRAFSAAQAQGVARTDLADDVFNAITKASDDLGDLGSGYQSIRESGATVSLNDGWAQSALKDFGLKFENGKVLADKASKTRNATDITKIQNFVDNWSDARTLTADEYLNMRHDLAELAKYDQAGSDVARQFATKLREGVLNSDEVRGQIPGLKNLDAAYAEDIKFYNSIKKDLLKPDGTFKDGAASKIVNSINSSNPERLARLEQLYPGFTQQAKVVKALEDVENAMGLKVGTYARAGVGITGIATGNLPLIIGAILATPEVAVPLLKGLGYTAETVGPVLKAIGDFATDINNFRMPGAVEQYIKEKYPDGVPVGLSTQTTAGKALRQIDFVDKMGRKQSIRLPIDEAKDYLAKLDSDGIKYSVTTP